MLLIDYIKRFFRILSTSSIDPEQHYRRLKLVERDIALPVKTVVLCITGYFLFFFEHQEMIVHGEDVNITLRQVKIVFLAYVIINIFGVIFYLFFNRWPLQMVHWVTLGMSIIDGLVLSALVVVTHGLDSMIYWVFIVLIVRNAISVPIPVTQISLNLITTVAYTTAISIWMAWIVRHKKQEGDAQLEENQSAVFMIEDYEFEGALFTIRVFFLVLMTALCYGVQVLFDRDRLAQLEAREYALRREQLRSTGRLAAEIAHRLKNPLAIINNAAFTLQRNLEDSANSSTKQLDMIRDEVNRSDMILTELMGYARLSDGRVEKIDVKEELTDALAEAFPININFEIHVTSNIPEALPPLMMQRAHLRQILVNLLVNAREAAGKGGVVKVSCLPSPNYFIEFRIKDSGGGVPIEQREQIFEAYFTTKEKGTGLGLAIVKQNTELYGGKIQVESELGKGTEFILAFPTRALLQNDES